MQIESDTPSLASKKPHRNVFVLFPSGDLIC